LFVTFNFFPWAAPIFSPAFVGPDLVASNWLSERDDK
jgi:hypothetical protein